jgi:hypothetical protein
MLTVNEDQVYWARNAADNPIDLNIEQLRIARKRLEDEVIRIWKEHNSPSTIGDLTRIHDLNGVIAVRLLAGSVSC